MPDPKQNLQEAIGSTDQLERLLLEKVEAAEAFAKQGRSLLEQMRGGFSKPSTLNPVQYAMLDPFSATALFLAEQDRALSEDELVEQLIARGVRTGATKQSKDKKIWNIRQSLSTNVRHKKLRKLNDRYGLPNWPDEKFK